MTAAGGSAQPAPAGDKGERIVRQLGELIGLVQEAEGEWQLDPEWFEEPLTRLEAIPTERLGELVALLETLLGPGVVTGGRSWYPLPLGGEEKGKAGAAAGPAESGFGLLIESASGIAGLGFRPPVKLPLGARFQGFVPLVDTRESRFVGASDEHPPRLTLDLLPPGGPEERFGDEEFSFAGLHLEVDLFFTRPPAVSFELEAVRFPGEEKPEDLSIVDTVAEIRDHPDKWIRRLLRLLLDKLADRLDPEGRGLHATVSNLLLILGLSLDEPDPERPDIPSPDWAKLVDDPGSAVAPWLYELADPDRSDVLERWLCAWAGLLQSVDAAEVGELPGSGTPDDPFLLPLLESSGGRSLSLSLAVEDDGGARRLVPGLRLASGSYEPAEGVATRLEASLDAARIKVTAAGAASIDAVCPRLELRLAMDSPDGGPLFELADPAPENSIRLEAVHAGLRLSHEGGSFHLAPLLDLAGAVVAPSTEPETYSLLGGDERCGRARATLARSLLRAFELYQPPDLAPPALEDAAEQEALAELVAPDVHEQLAWQLFGPRYAELRDLLLALIFGEEKPAPQRLIDETPGRLEELLAGLSDPLELLQAFARRFEDGDFNPLVGWLFAESVPGFEAPPAGEPPFFSLPLGDELRLGIGSPAEGRFGIRLQPRHQTGRVEARADVDLSMDVRHPGLPDLEVAAHLGLSSSGLGVPELEPGPELSLKLGVTGEGAPEFSTWLWLTGEPAQGEDGFLMSLLPGPYLAYRPPADPAAKPIRAEDWFLELAPRLLRPLVDGLLLSQKKVYSRLDRPFAATGVSAGLVLTRWQLLQPESGEEARGPYRLADPDTLAGLEPKKLLAAVLTAFGDQAEAGGVRLFPLEAEEEEEPVTRGVYVVRSAEKEYGLRLVATDVAMGKGTSRLVLQLGKPPRGAEKWLEKARQDGDGPAPGPPGVTLLLVKDQEGVHFAPRLELVDVGFDLLGAAGGSDKPTPLVRKGGYEIAGLQPRLYLRSEPFAMGAAIQVAGIGIPLGPPAGGGNPVAQNLLGSGGGKEAEAEANPTFSATVAYAGELWGEIHGDVPSSDGKVWLPVQRAFGPLFCRRIGLDFESQTAKLYVGYDGKVSVGPLEVDLVDLSVGIPLREPGNLGEYELGLEGLSLSFDKPPISIAGSLFKAEVGGRTEYAGSAVLKTAAMTISGFGSFGSIDGEISMFVFALLDKDLGGPSFFHVTGLAAGFGYNRDLKLPSVDHVEEFPLVRGVLSPGYFGGATDNKQALVKLGEYLPARRGAYWLALGVKFTSFEMIESVALLAVKFGTQTVISLLGVSTLAIPKGASPDDAIAYARLLLKAELVPSAGTLKVDGKLTDDSHVFSKDCHLRGGFAFYIWFKEPHEGDFVVTVGGYHPKYLPKPHYPTVERLGFDWAISSHMHVDGELFFALTPSCLMAGGRLSARFHAGGLKAWYVAHASFLMYWQPFHYQIDIGISVGVSYTFKVIVTITLKIELSADLSLFGPPFAGRARLCYGPLDFTVKFGPQGQKIEALGWQEFRDKMLPAQPISIDVTRGLIRQDPVEVVFDKKTGEVSTPWLEAARENRADEYSPGEGEEARSAPWPVVNSHELRVATRSALPSTETTLERGTVEGGGAPELGIRPMDRRRLDCRCVVEIRPVAGGELSAEAAPLVGFVQRTGVPQAMWGPEEWEKKLTPGDKVIDNVPTGMIIRLGTYEPTHALPPLDQPGIALEKFKWEPIPKQLGWRPIEVEEHDADGKTFADSIWGDTEIDPRRSAVRAALQSVTPHPLNEIGLELFQQTWEQVLQARPRWSSLGVEER